MRKLILILIALLPTLAFAQQDSTQPSFKIVKKKTMPKLAASNQPDAAPFLFCMAYYEGGQKPSDFFRKGDDPNLLIQNIVGLDVYMPTWIPNRLGTYYFKTGIYGNDIAKSELAFSVPADFGFIFHLNNLNVIVEAGQRFFLHCNDLALSDNILFEWGGGISHSFALGKSWGPLQLAINYKRLVNEGFIELSLNKQFGAIF